VVLRRPTRSHQATGRDAKGRKQYRYHDKWQQARGEAKFDSLVDFGHALPILRERIDADMRHRNLSLDRVVATTVWLLDRTLIRIGNAEYATDSYGLTTLLDEHVDVTPATLRFRFVGKSASRTTSCSATAASPASSASARNFPASSCSSTSPTTTSARHRLARRQRLHP
jgi:DNA topoisomerase IB